MRLKLPVGVPVVVSFCGLEDGGQCVKVEEAGTGRVHFGADDSGYFALS